MHPLQTMTQRALTAAGADSLRSQVCRWLQSAPLVPVSVPSNAHFATLLPNAFH